MSFKFDNSVGYESVWCGIADKELMIQWNSRLKTGYGLLNSSAFNLSTLDVSVKCEVVGREPTNYIIKTRNFFSPLTVGTIALLWIGIVSTCTVRTVRDQCLYE